MSNTYARISDSATASRWMRALSGVSPALAAE